MCQFTFHLKCYCAGTFQGISLNRSRDNCQSGGTYLFPLMHHGACVVAFINRSLYTYHGATKFVTNCWNVVCGLPVRTCVVAFNFCNRLLECTYACGLWFATDCVGLLHTACTIFRCLHDDTRLSETCKRTSKH